MPLLRFHWDFFGPDAKRTAEHFLHHLDEFNKKEGITDYRHWTVDHQVKVSAVLECDQRHLLLIRDRLKPVRGERVLEGKG